MLRLSIENTPSLTSGDPIEVVLQEHGLVIGRAAHADWTLPDARNHISSIHCEIDYRDGRYHLTDRSTNGTFINGAGERLSKPTQLRDGDLIQIGQYEIRVEEEASAISQPVAGSAPISPPSRGINWDVDAPAARPIPTGQFGREPARPVFQNAADPLMGSYSAPSAGRDPFGLGAMSGRALPSSAPVSDDPFGLSGATAAARPAGHDDLFGLSGSAPPSGNPFGLSSAPPIIPPTPSRPPQADPFGLPSTAPPSTIRSVSAARHRL